MRPSPPSRAATQSQRCHPPSHSARRYANQADFESWMQQHVEEMCGAAHSARFASVYATPPFLHYIFVTLGQVHGQRRHAAAEPSDRCSRCDVAACGQSLPPGRQDYGHSGAAAVSLDQPPALARARAHTPPQVPHRPRVQAQRTVARPSAAVLFPAAAADPSRVHVARAAHAKCAAYATTARWQKM